MSAEDQILTQAPSVADQNKLADPNVEPNSAANSEAEVAAPDQLNIDDLDDLDDLLPSREAFGARGAALCLDTPNHHGDSHQGASHQNDNQQEPTQLDEHGRQPLTAEQQARLAELLAPVQLPDQTATINF